MPGQTASRRRSILSKLCSKAFLGHGKTSCRNDVVSLSFKHLVNRTNICESCKSKGLTLCDNPNSCGLAGFGSSSQASASRATHVARPRIQEQKITTVKQSRDVECKETAKKIVIKIRTWRSIRIVDLLDWRSSGISVLCLDLRLRQQKATLE